MLREKCFMLIIQAVWLGVQVAADYAEGATDSRDFPALSEVVSDFLSMDTEEFENRYDRNELYGRDMLYCVKEAWRYQGEPVPFGDGDYYNVEEITAVRFASVFPEDMDMYGKNDYLAGGQEIGNVILQYFGDYAISMYFLENKSGMSREERNLIEFSYIKVKLRSKERNEAAPEELYEILEEGYYQDQEEVRQAEWNISPGGTKAVYILNGLIPNNPSQIYVRFQEKVPDLIFRNTWQYFFAGWIDEDHFICYNDAGPVLIHLETEHIEAVKKEEDDYDAWGCHYELKGNQMIAIFSDEEYYRWDIIRENGDIYLESRDGT